ncbi:DUF4259 domain-containing protein [Streptomyces hydrogenans]
MGAWGTGPFDDDTAADFANTLDAAEPGGSADRLLCTVTDSWNEP